MTVIRVNPESVQAYGTAAQGHFDAMHQSLVDLVNQVVDVHYFGPNAVQFKTDCGTLASAFANALAADLGAMADAVRTSTSNIAASLGGAAITITVDGKPISPPVPATVDYVDVDTTALEGAVPTVTQRFDAIRTGLGSHLSDLEATDWQGNAKESAVSSIQQFTTTAITRCDDAQQSLVDFINAQLDSVQMADV